MERRRDWRLRGLANSKQLSIPAACGMQPQNCDLYWTDYLILCVPAESEVDTEAIERAVQTKTSKAG